MHWQHLNQYIDIFCLENVVRLVLLVVFNMTAENIIWPVFFFIFLFMVTGRGIIFLSSAECNRIPTCYSYQKLKHPHHKTNQGLRALSYDGPSLW